MLVQFIETFQGWPHNVHLGQGSLFDGPYHIECGDIGLTLHPHDRSGLREVLVGNLIFKVPPHCVEILSDGGCLN